MSAIRGEGQFRGPIQLQSNALAALEAIDLEVAEKVMQAGCVVGNKINGLLDGICGSCRVFLLLLPPDVLPPDPLHPKSSPTTATHFPAGNPAKLGDFSLFSCLRTLVEPRKSQICVFLPLLSVGFNLWV
ncbi:hypothetical protein SLEP1_g31533 [Rubroshorea leprosula]|uniref:Uncharacterized protein n=1 Tax=Rubroshorea leprosula TaxID=152421 RepID=A0AAV5K3M3_9ROSI|nr:hypothetical protein SLEP1_g31533 [Rubroshorea leprosula]